MQTREKGVAAPKSSGNLEDSAAYLMHGLIEQEINSSNTWQRLQHDLATQGRVRIMVNRIFCESAPSSRCRWLALALTWCEGAPSMRVKASRRSIELAHAIIGI